MKRQVTRTGKFVGVWVPAAVVNAIEQWQSQGNERNSSNFLREAAREKLKRDGIAFNENVELPTT